MFPTPISPGWATPFPVSSSPTLPDLGGGGGLNASNPLLYVVIALVTGLLPVLFVWLNGRAAIKQLKSTNNETMRVSDESSYRLTLEADNKRLRDKTEADDKKMDVMNDRLSVLEQRRTVRDAQVAALAAMVLEINPQMKSRVDTILSMMDNVK